MQTFNYKLSKVRLVVENAFGKLKARFRVLKRLECEMENGNSIVRAHCVLHSVCEHMPDQRDTQWSAEAAAGELSEPVCVSNAASSSGGSARRTLVKRTFSLKL